MDTILETQRLKFRTWTQEDAADAFRIWGDPRVMRLVDDGVPIADVEEARCILGRAMVAQDLLGVSLWPVIEKATGKVVGACGFHRFEGGPALELAYHFVPECWGRGLASEAVRGCLGHAFEVLKAPRIIALRIHPENSASRRVLEKLGFVPAGQVEGEELYEVTPGS